MDVTGQVGLAFGQFILQRLEARQQAGGVGIHDLALGRGADAAGGAQEQPLPQPRLDGRQPFGGEGRGHAQLVCGRAQAMQLMDGPYQGQIVGIHLFSLWK